METASSNILHATSGHRVLFPPQNNELVTITLKIYSWLWWVLPVI